MKNWNGLGSSENMIRIFSDLSILSVRKWIGFNWQCCENNTKWTDRCSDYLVKVGGSKDFDDFEKWVRLVPYPKVLTPMLWLTSGRATDINVECSILPKNTSTCRLERPTVDHWPSDEWTTHSITWVTAACNHLWHHRSSWLLSFLL